MGSIAEKTAEAELMPRFKDGSVNLQELVRVAEKMGVARLSKDQVSAWPG